MFPKDNEERLIRFLEAFGEGLKEATRHLDVVDDQPQLWHASAASDLESGQEQSAYIGILGDAQVIFKRTTQPPKEINAFKKLITCLKGPVPKLSPFLRKVVLVARQEYASLRDPLIAWESPNALRGIMRRLLAAVATNHVAERVIPLEVSRDVLNQIDLKRFAAVAPDLSLGIRPEEIAIARKAGCEADEDDTRAYMKRKRVMPTVSGMYYDHDWFHYLFVEAKTGSTSASTLRVLSAMRAALGIVRQMFCKALSEDEEPCFPMGEMATVYGVVATGVSWEVYKMQLVRATYETMRIWDGHVDRPRDLLHFMALMNMVVASAPARLEIIGNWLWCMRPCEPCYDGEEPAPIQYPRRGEQKRKADPPADAPKCKRHAVADTPTTLSTPPPPHRK